MIGVGDFFDSLLRVLGGVNLRVIVELDHFSKVYSSIEFF